jgi:hypothetical protein
MLLLRLLRSAEPDQRLPPRFFRVHSGAQILFDGHLQMRRHFRIKFLIQFVATEK